MDALVLAGGAARRMDGADKAGQLVAGRSLLRHVVDATRAAGVERVIVVGPPRADVEGVTWCVEDPPGGGPVAAIAAGLPLTSAGHVLVLAADLPDIAPAIPMLLAALDAAGCAVLVDTDGRRNPLAAAWRRAELQAAVAGIGDVAGAAARALLEQVTVLDVPDTDGWGTDCDTWDDLAAARRRASAAHVDRRTS